MIAYIGGSHVGAIGLLISEAYSKVSCCVAYSEEVKIVADKLGIKTYKSIHDSSFVDSLNECDFLLCVHGRQIVKLNILKTLPCVNVHPCYFKYKGADPIGRLLKTELPYYTDVTAHFMTEEVDEGQVISTRKKIIDNVFTEKDVYRELYMTYGKVILDVFDKNILKEGKK